MFSRDSIGSVEEAQVHQACAELRRRLHAGEDCRAEDVAASFPSLASEPDQLLELVLAELATRRALGQTLRPEDWYARYPQWRARLWLYFEVEGQATVAAAEAIGSTGQRSPQTRPAEANGRSVGTAFGRYVLFEQLGRGGMGVVYRARDTVLDRVVALKMIQAGALAQPEAVERFYREARATAKLKHPHIIGIYDIDEHQGEHYLTMELAPGGSLSRHKGRFSADPAAAAALVEKVARGVHHAHTKGILHRDLKPGNILLDEHGEPRVGDFGLAKFLDADPELTQSGGQVGTPSYMAPEQAGGRPAEVSPRTDVWALGVVLYELLTGQRPFTGSSNGEVTQQVLTREPPRPRAVRRGLSRDLEAVVLKCLEKDPARRYASAEALSDDLARWLRGEPTSVRPKGPWRWAWRRLRRSLVGRAAAVLVVAIVLVLVGGTLAVYSLPSEQSQDSDNAEQRAEQARARRAAEQRQQALLAIERRLAAGQPVTLVGQTGLPRWYRWAVRPDQPPLKPGLRGRVDLIAMSTTLLELVPDPRRPAYRFSAEVAVNAWKSGDAGLYFLAEQRPTEQGVEHYCCALTFANEGTFAKRAHLKLIRTDGEGCFYHTLTTMPLPPAPPAGADRVAWRTLAAEITPAGVQASIDGVVLPKVSAAAWHQQAQGWWSLMRSLPGPPVLGPAPAYEPQRPLGVYVRQSRAFFRNVTIRPQHGPD